MEKKYLTELAETVVKIKSTGLATEFLKNILTPTELEAITRRLQIVKLLKQGQPQWDVAERLRVGIATVTRGARELKNPQSAFHKILS